MTTVIPICRLGAFLEHVYERLNSAQYCFARQSLRDGEEKL